MTKKNNEGVTISFVSRCPNCFCRLGVTLKEEEENMISYSVIPLALGGAEEKEKGDQDGIE